MARIPLSHYIPLGCLIISEIESNLPHELWSLTLLSEWHHLASEPRDHNLVVSSQTRLLPPYIQQLVLSSAIISPFKELFQKQWIQLAFIVNIPQHAALIRVYLLPDDIDRSIIERTDPFLRAARLYLLSCIDFSPSTWRGEIGTSRSSSPLLHQEAAISSDHSLLQMFNDIPSPDPRPELISDLNARDAACNLLASNVKGLSTNLYPYQRRSAALMLQKEDQPEKVLDPRLMKATDQNHTIWYYDAVGGLGLREPRHYDAVRGGILAEEMGLGKTLICLALILATKYQSSQSPDVCRNHTVTRSRVGSLIDMAAACATRNAVPWKLWLGEDGENLEYAKCKDAIRRNRGYYLLERPALRRQARHPQPNLQPWKIYLSHATLIVVPGNLVRHWKQEIDKHTRGLAVLIVANKRVLPPVEGLLEFDIILFSSSCFERLRNDEVVDHNTSHPLGLPLASIRFKRCIVDEGHKLGSSTARFRSNLHLVLDSLQVSTRWIVTGTPSKGLFGVGPGDSASTPSSPSPAPLGAPSSDNRLAEQSSEQERDDLKRIGSIATYFFKARPWANTIEESGDKPVDWAAYIMQPKHSRRSTGRRDCLKSTLESLIVRHRICEVSKLLPVVDERVVYLDGSYQDKLSLNLFSMMIIFNAVQSQRTDQDYFFHRRQRKALLELVSNLRQASFFGASFFSLEEIHKAVETAEKFLAERKIPISNSDESLLSNAIAFGRLAAKNNLKLHASMFHEIPMYVKSFPGGCGKAWSLDQQESDPVCMSSGMVLALQKHLQPTLDAPNSLELLFKNGSLENFGRTERTKTLESQMYASRHSVNRRASSTPALAGNAQLGIDRSGPRKPRPLQSTVLDISETSVATEGTLTEVAEPLAATQIISTVSAKFSYLIDQVMKYQHDEQILIFYENDNVAYYLSGVLDVLQVLHLIYAKSLTPERRGIYVDTFNHSPKFRVLLMDISQAAFGLDMRSASRIYFINPILNPQVEAQAIGRARRISQAKPVTVETLVLRGSVEEVIVKRRREMTQAEQHRCRHSILDDAPIREWILHADILPLPNVQPDDGLAQTALLRAPQFVFGRGFGREIEHPDQDLVALPGSPKQDRVRPTGVSDRDLRMKTGANGIGAARDDTIVGAAGSPLPAVAREKRRSPQDEEPASLPARPARRVRFVAGADEGAE